MCGEHLSEDGKLAITSLFSAVNCGGGMNTCQIGGTPRPGEFVVNLWEEREGGLFMASLQVPLI